MSALDYPPTMLVIGGLDPLQGWQRRFRDGLARAGKAVRLVENPGMMHGFYVMGPSLAGIEMLLREAREFITQYTNCRKIASFGTIYSRVFHAHLAEFVEVANKAVMEIGAPIPIRTNKYVLIHFSENFNSIF